MKKILFQKILCLAIFSGNVIASVASPVPNLLSNKSIPPRTIEWTDLMPAEDLQLIENMPKVNHDNLSKAELARDKPVAKNSLRPAEANSKFENSTVENSNKKRTWKDALVSTKVRPEFNNINIRLAGYIVPLEYTNKDLVRTFFFVPYFGACIHVPPPPPNQIIYVQTKKPFSLKELYTPFWVTGKITLETVKKDIGESSYSLDAETIKEYVGEE